MARKIIQVPVEEELLHAMDVVSKKEKRARAALIRQACLNYLRQAEDKEMDRLYRQGYEKMPEATELGEAQSALTGQVLSRELW